MTPETEQVLKSLRANTEGCSEMLADGSEWRTVYLWNAIPPGMKPHAFAGHLSALQKAGLYTPQDDGVFGDVLCT